MGKNTKTAADLITPLKSKTATAICISHVPNKQDIVADEPVNTDLWCKLVP